MSPARSALWLPAAGLVLALAPYVNAAWNTPAFGRLNDQPIHLALSQDFADALSHGEIPPSWSASLSGGRGGPAFVLYPPLFFALTTVCSLVAPTPEWALGLALWTSVAWIFFAIYYLARAELSPQRSVLAATLAPLLPGLALIGWARGLLPSFLALGFVALLLGAGVRLINGDVRGRNWIILTLAAAGVLLTHALTSVMTAALIAACLPAVGRRMGVRGLLGGAAAALAAAVLTAWFWLPMLAAASRAKTSYLAELHPYERSLWFAPAGAGDGFSQAWADLNEFGLMVAGVQLLLAAVAVFALRGKRKTIAAATLPWVAGLVLLASVYPVGAWLAALPGLTFLQFAWRWQGPLAVWCVLGLASVPRERLTGAAAVFGLATLFFLPLFTPSDEERPSVADMPNRPLTAEEYAEVEPGLRTLYVTNLIEMRPKGASMLRYPPGRPGRVDVVSGAAEIEATHIGQARREYRIRISDPAVLRLRTYAFPGWTAEWNGEPAAIEREASTALQLVRLPAGTGTLQLSYTRTELLSKWSAR